jgi:hypothetical protein
VKFSDKEQAMATTLDPTMLRNVLPTGFHGALRRGPPRGLDLYAVPGLYVTEDPGRGRRVRQARLALRSS